MKITKFEHACFVAEEGGMALVVDPGDYTTDFVSPDDVVAVVVTHKHPDHLNKDHLQAIVDKNPDVIIIGHEEVTKELDGFTTQAVTANEGFKVGAFELEFFGGEHAVIRKGWPIVANLGVMINGKLYYPGDSFTVPDRPVEVLALPVGAPWLNFDAAADFYEAIKPKLAFPTHDAVLSDAGKGLPDRMMPSVAEGFGGRYERLKDPIEI